MVTDPALLAQEARRALAAGQQATLLLPELAHQRTDADDAFLLDEDGRPQLLCAADSMVVTAARNESAAVLQVAVREAGRPRGCVTLTGHLVLVGTLDDAAQTAVVELAIARITLERGDQRTAHEIPLELYGCPTEQALIVYAHRLLGHTNAGHGPELRAFAAARRGLDPAAVADAHLVDPTPAGCSLAWVDLAGAHVDQLHFPAPAPTPRQFAARLREVLGGPAQPPVDPGAP